MNSRPTPETNEAKREGLMRGNTVPTQVVHVSVAERLEQQRDAAISRFESSQSARMELKRERDEARELARDLRDALSRLRSQMQIADNDHDVTVRVFQIPTGEVRRADLFLTRAKEVLP
jgi:hypothetical protein